MKLDTFTAWVQAILSAIYLVATFIVIIIYELAMLGIIQATEPASPGQEKTFDSMVSWMTGGALIVLYFWLSRAKANTTPDPATTTVTQTTETHTAPSKPTGATNAPPDSPEPPAGPPDRADKLRDPQR